MVAGAITPKCYRYKGALKVSAVFESQRPLRVDMDQQPPAKRPQRPCFGEPWTSVDAYTFESSRQLTPALPRGGPPPKVERPMTAFLDESGVEICDHKTDRDGRERYLVKTWKSIEDIDGAASLLQNYRSKYDSTWYTVLRN